jgi:hypothetical protein
MLGLPILIVLPFLTWLALSKKSPDSKNDLDISKISSPPPDKPSTP